MARTRILDPITCGWAVVTSVGLFRLALGFVASLVIARALGPAAFGIYAVLAATVGVVGSVAEGGLTEAAVLRIAAVWPTDARAAQRRAGAFFWIRLGLAGAVVGLGCAVAGPLSRAWLDTDDGLLRWALLGIVATAASGAIGGMLQATGAFARMSSLTLANTALTVVLALGLEVLGRLDLLSALVVLGIGTSLATFAFGRGMLPPGWALRLPDVRTLSIEARRLARTGRWLWLAGMFAMLTANAEVLLLNRWAALPLVGAYALALNLASKADLVNHSLYTVLLPGVSGLRDRAAVGAFVRRGLLRSGLIALILLAIIPISAPVIVLAYGNEFASAVDLFRLLLGVTVFDVLLTPLLLLPLAYRRPKLLAVADAVRAITLVAVALVTIPTFGAFGAIVARFAARVAGAGVMLVLLWPGRATALKVQHEEAPGVVQ